MNRRRAQMTFACATVALALLACTRASDFERMRLQRRADPFAASGAFADGTAMRPLPEGAVAFHADESQPPVTPETIESGHRAYAAVCAVCHGADGSSQVPMTVNMPLVPPPPLNTARVQQLSDAELFAIVSRGRNRMPAYDWSLPAADRWAVVAYLRTVGPK